MFCRYFFLGLTLIVISTLEARRNISAEDIVNIQYVKSATMSPNGDNIVYELSIPQTKNIRIKSRTTQLWVMRKQDLKPIQFTSSYYDSFSPQWLRDGSEITFLSKREHISHKSQLFSISMSGGEANLMFEHPSGINSYKWSPNGKWLAYLSTDTLSISRTKNINDGFDMILVDKNFLYQRLWLHNTITKKTNLIFKDDIHILDFIWSNDSKTIIFQGAKIPGADSGLMNRILYEVKIPKNRPRKITNFSGKLGLMDISPNNSKLAFLGAITRNDPLPQTIFTIDLKNTDNINSYQGIDESFYDLQWMNNKMILARSIKRTKTVLSLIEDLNKKKENAFSRKIIYKPDFIISSAKLHLKSGQLLITGHSSNKPAELYLKDLYEDNIFQVSNSNPFLREINFGRQETISWKSIDGQIIDGILTYPPNFREGIRYPLILQIHGGPEGVSLDGWTTSPTYPIQLIAANGFLILQPNYRGSGGRGINFSKSNHNDLGGLEFQDVLYGMDYLVESGIVNAGKIGTGGWSYGGYFSALGATKFSHRFKASVVGAGLSNMISFMGTTDIPNEMSIVHWNSFWFDEIDTFWERSPLAHIKKAKTPTLIFHGSQDKRVHPEQGLELYQALKMNNVDTELVFYPREKHGVKERSHQLDYMERMISWFNEYVK